jgi:hypothetical protein
MSALMPASGGPVGGVGESAKSWGGRGRVTVSGASPPRLSYAKASRTAGEGGGIRVLEVEADVECVVRLRHGRLLSGLDENTLSLGALTTSRQPASSGDAPTPCTDVWMLTRLKRALDLQYRSV